MRSCYNPENFKPYYPPKQVEEIPVAFETVRVPASVGDSKTYPPTQGAYINKIVQYEADRSVWLYDSLGNYTRITINDLTSMVTSVNGKTGVVLLKTSDIENDSGYATVGELATVASTGSYNDLENKPVIGEGDLTIKRNNQDIGIFSANSVGGAIVNIDVPTSTSDLVNDSGYVESDDLSEVATTGSYNDLDDKPTIDNFLDNYSTNAIQNNVVSNALDRAVTTNVSVDSTASTSVVQLDMTKTNLKNSSTTTSSLSLPVASSSQAGIMNAATYDAVTSNTNNINALMNGAVAVTGLPASASQSDITTAWQTETGLSTLINRASVYDVTNEKVWTYYTNDTTWHESSNTTQVTVNTFTNTSEGIIKGSTMPGQVFAESDGTGSVNGWDTLNATVSSQGSKLSTIAQGAEANVQSNWAETDTSSDAYIRNKPTIPTVNNATLTIQKNGTTVQTFTANSSTNKTANITVPTIILSTTDIGIGATLAANTLYGVYS